MIKKFEPADFEVLDSFLTAKYRLEILTPDVTKMNYDVVMPSRARLRNVFGENTEDPKDDMSLEENTEDLRRHKKIFKACEAFAYTVLSLPGDRYIGCVYIDTTNAPDYDYEVYQWVRDSEISLDDHFYLSIRR